MWPGRARSAGLRRRIDRRQHRRRAIARPRCRWSSGPSLRSARRTRCRTASVFCDTISGISSSSSRSGVIDRQISPRPYRAMKLIASGVTFSAAIVRSPSFSRSSSSTTMIIRPARMASTASSMRANGPGRLPASRPWRSSISVDVMDLLPSDFSVRPASSAARTTYLPTMSHSRLTRSPTLRPLQVRVLQRKRHDLHVEPVGAEAGDGQADAVDRDRALRHDVRRRARAGKLTVSQWNSASRPQVLDATRRRRRAPARSARRTGRRRAAAARG